MNKKVIGVMITLLLVITTVGVTVLIFIMNNDDKSSAEGEKTVEEMIEDSFETEQITTDLKDGNFVRIKFRLVTDNEDTKETLEQDFRLKNIIIKELSTKEEEDFRDGLTSLEESIKDKVNDLLNEGEVTDVYTTEKVLQ
ncbi:flagellar basal body-associated protein FliL [Salirhabdus sp. Marseille-P4669]|uniref:flagellar basal body-associated protein FliL n=1 Tax=Salirhabdus sp. Marseille-P4669 TaxID=2042310 RepID=UPI000C796A20|nr:flagellar basal body-associated protein FliL [Salirhabdus sp. Marseille-P4669]